METQRILLMLVLLAIAMAVGLYLPARLTRRAMGQVIRRFYEHGAINPQNAKTLDALGLRPPSFVEKISRPRDYKPSALKVLQQIGAIQITDEGRLYLAEENLHESLKIKKGSSG